MLVDSIVDAIGDTPLVRVNRVRPEASASIWVKLESWNPGGSVKDRPARHMVHRAAERGELVEGGAIAEASSGNLGAALAMIGAALGHPVHIMVDPRTSFVNLAMIRAFGATQVMVTEPDEYGKFQLPRIREARRTAAELGGAYLPNQWGNPDNPVSHETTAAEIVRDLDGQVDAVVCAVSSCGQLTGVGRALKRFNPRCRVVAVDAVGSMALGGAPGVHKLSGLGSGFTPNNFDANVIDEAYWCGDADGMSACRLIARHEGFLVGGSAGAAHFIAMKIAAELPIDANVVVIAADGGEKYLQTVYNDDWVAQNGIDLVTDPEELVGRARRYQPTAGAQLRPTRRIEA